MAQAQLSINKNRLKIYEGNKCYLSNGSNFEIELTNNGNVKYKAEIFINDKSIGEIVVNKGHYYLERFLDSNTKFVFNTFKVDDVSATKKPRERNGKVKIVFYPETREVTFVQSNLTSTNWSPIKFNSPYYGSSTAVYTANYSTTDKISTGRVEEGEYSNQTFASDYNTIFSNRPSDIYEYQILPIDLKPYEDTKIYCTECGLSIKNNKWKYCPKCGTKLC